MSHENQLFSSAYQLWEQSRNTQKFFDKDASLWTNDDEAQWMGWLSLPILNEKEIQAMVSLSHDILKAGFKHILLLGMGGSSLFPEMMAKIYRCPQLVILDSTDPLQIRHVEENINLTKTFIIVSSKSGSTLESHLLLEYFYGKLKALHQKDSVGDCFAAITDPGSKLESFAKENYFKALFHGLPSIGGRYSALSAFGLLPFCLIGGDVQRFIENAQNLSRQCMETQAFENNPGVSLGIQLGELGKQGKNKLTFVISEKLRPFGGWLEQLIAESSGKNEKGLIPVIDEPLTSPQFYDDDRVFISIELESSSSEIQQKLTALEKAGHPVIKCIVKNIEHVGAECYRWEIATAVACSALSVNPFNQPDVELTKIKTHKIIQSIKDESFSEKINSASESEWKLFFDSIQPHDYFNICAFLEMSDENEVLLQKIRVLVRDKKRVATSLGFGPRFLHSTGQAHKGGPNSGAFLQLVRDYSPSEDITLPDKTLTFGKVIRAQAAADLEVLKEKSRRTCQINLELDPTTTLQRLLSFLEGWKA